jgi:8-oxo-dGTP pyrophosphatase MutT (NUDIX family)
VDRTGIDYLYWLWGGATIGVVKRKLKQVLSRRPKHHITDARYIPSAVLIPLYQKEGQYHILFIQRTERVKDHKGQISFPGGAYEERDGTLLNTALREAAEEVGLKADDIEILGELDDMLTIGSGYIISPFVAAIPWPYKFKVDNWETEEVIEVPLSVLLDKDCIRQGTDEIDGQEITTYFYHCGDKVIWGATARILNQFLDIIAGIVENR